MLIAILIFSIFSTFLSGFWTFGFILTTKDRIEERNKKRARERALEGNQNLDE